MDVAIMGSGAVTSSNRTHCHDPTGSTKTNLPNHALISAHPRAIPISTSGTRPPLKGCRNARCTWLKCWWLRLASTQPHWKPGCTGLSVRSGCLHKESMRPGVSFQAAQGGAGQAALGMHIVQ